MSVETTHEPRRIDVGGTTVLLRDLGRGDALLCLHGAAPGADGWNNFGRNAPAFADDFRVIVPDLPGFGGSDQLPDNASSIPELATFYRRMLGVLGVDAVHVLGFATGGAVAMEMALQAPELVRSLVLVNSAGGLPVTTPSPTEGVRAIFSYYGGEGPSRAKMEHYLALSVFDQSVITPGVVDERYRASLAQVARSEFTGYGDLPPLWTRLSGIAAPTLVIWGRENRVQVLDSGLFLMRNLPNAEFHVLSGAGLQAQIEQPERFAELVLGFTRRHRAATEAGR